MRRSPGHRHDGHHPHTWAGAPVRPSERAQAGRLPGRRPGPGRADRPGAPRQVLRRRGISFQRTRTWKEPTDPDRDAKPDRIEEGLSNVPDRCLPSTSSGRCQVTASAARFVVAVRRRAELELTSRLKSIIELGHPGRDAAVVRCPLATPAWTPGRTDSRSAAARARERRPYGSGDRAGRSGTAAQGGAGRLVVNVGQQRRRGSRSAGDRAIDEAGGRRLPLRAARVRIVG